MIECGTIRAYTENHWCCFGMIILCFCIFGGAVSKFQPHSPVQKTSKLPPPTPHPTPHPTPPLPHRKVILVLYSCRKQPSCGGNLFVKGFDLRQQTPQTDGDLVCSVLSIDGTSLSRFFLPALLFFFRNQVQTFDALISYKSFTQTE